MSRLMRQLVLNLVKGILLYYNGQGVAKVNLDAENGTEVLRKLRSFLLGPLFVNEEVASFLDEWVRGETVMVENEEETWLLEESLSPSEDPLGLKAMSFEGHLPMPCIHVRFSLHPEIGITVSNTIREVVKEESIAV